MNECAQEHQTALHCHSSLVLLLQHCQVFWKRKGSPKLLASITQRASSAGSVTEMRSPVSDLGLFAMNRSETQTPGIFNFSKLWHEQRVYFPDELFSVQQQPN